MRWSSCRFARHGEERRGPGRRDGMRDRREEAVDEGEEDRDCTSGNGIGNWNLGLVKLVYHGDSSSLSHE